LEQWPRKVQNQLPAATAPLLDSKPPSGPTADKPRVNLNAAEYKNLVPDRLFLKYISDAFAVSHAALLPKLRSGELRVPAPQC